MGLHGLLFEAIDVFDDIFVHVVFFLRMSHNNPFRLVAGLLEQISESLPIFPIPPQQHHRILMLLIHIRLYNDILLRIIILSCLLSLSKRVKVSLPKVLRFEFGTGVFRILSQLQLLLNSIRLISVISILDAFLFHVREGGYVAQVTFLIDFATLSREEGVVGLRFPCRRVPVRLTETIGFVAPDRLRRYAINRPSFRGKQTLSLNNLMASMLVGKGTCTGIRDVLVALEGRRAFLYFELGGSLVMILSRDEMLRTIEQHMLPPFIVKSGRDIDRARIHRRKHSRSDPPGTTHNTRAGPFPLRLRLRLIGRRGRRRARTHRTRQQLLYIRFYLILGIEHFVQFLRIKTIHFLIMVEILAVERLSLSPLRRTNTHYALARSRRCLYFLRGHSLDRVTLSLLLLHLRRRLVINSLGLLLRWQFHLRLVDRATGLFAHAATTAIFVVAIAQVDGDCLVSVVIRRAVGRPVVHGCWFVQG